MLGRLVPRWIHNQRVNDRDEQIKLLLTMLDKRDAQFEKLVEQNEITVKLLEDLKRASAERRGAPR